jgi:hypothetical protein
MASGQTGRINRPHYQDDNLEEFHDCGRAARGWNFVGDGQNGLPTGGQSPVAGGANGGGSRQGILQVSLEPLEISVCVRLRGAGRTRTSNQTVIAETRVNQGSPH